VFLLIETKAERPFALFPAGRFRFSKAKAKVAVAIYDFGLNLRI